MTSVRGRRVTRGAPLDYEVVRATIRDGDIVLFRGHSWASRAIGALTRSSYSHAGILAWWNGRLMVIEAVAAGVLTSRMSYVVERYSGNVDLWTAHEDHDARLARDEVLRSAQLVIGRSYSKYKLLRNLYRMALGRAGDDPADPDAEPDDFLCSEFVSRVWRKGGVDLEHDVPDVFTRPSDIARSPSLRMIGELHRSTPDTRD